MVSIKEIFIYPIKGCAGIPVSSWPINARGLQYDRQWMLVDQQDRFISQREHPALAFFQISFQNHGWEVRYSGDDNCIMLPLSPSLNHMLEVQIWDDRVRAAGGFDEWDAYFSTHLNQHVRLVFFPETSTRRVDPQYSPNEHHVQFSDGYPVLVIGTASLDYLNSKLSDPIGFDRFRPNIIVETSTPHIEDTWSSLSHPEYELPFAKPCARCIVTTINQNTGVKGAEPLLTLSTYRKTKNKINFGMNALAVCRSEKPAIRQGDKLLEVII